MIDQSAARPRTTTRRKAAVAAAAVGLLTTAAPASALTVTALTAPAAAGAPLLTAFSAPMDDQHRWDRERGRGWDGDRARNDGWDGHPWRWWHDWGIPADYCRDGGGHEVGDHCQGGRFGDFHVR